MRLYLPLAAAYVGLVVLANWLASAYVWSVPLTPWVAPAGVFAVGVVLVVRDWTQQAFGLWRTMPLVYVAGVLSFAVGELAGWTSLARIAVASLVAFTVSESLEAVCFTPLRRRYLALAVALSASVALLLDSYVFLTVSGLGLGFFDGQVAAKAEVVAIGVALTLARRRLLPTALYAPQREAA